MKEYVESSKYFQFALENTLENVFGFGTLGYGKVV